MRARKRWRQQYPQYATQITAAAKTSFLAGDQYAYIAGIIAVLIGAALVFFVFPKRDEERQMVTDIISKDMADMARQAKAGPASAPAAAECRQVNGALPSFETAAFGLVDAAAIKWLERYAQNLKTNGSVLMLADVNPKG